MPVDSSKYFKLDEKTITEIPGGYVSELDVPIPLLNENFTVDCNNVDMEGFIKKRNPYDIYLDLESILPVNYKIAKFAEKNFTDGLGNNQKVIIVCAKPSDESRSTDEAAKMRIYANYYYLPAAGYENAWKNGTYNAGFVNGWVELTERYSGRATAGSIEFIANLSYNANGIATIGGIRYQLKSTSLKLQKDRDYFKGWFLADNNGELCGIITGSIWYSNSALFQVKMTANAPVSTMWSIVRFPVNQFNKDKWQDIENIDINIEEPNVVRFYFGEESETIWLGFIQDRTHFGGYRVKSFTWSDSGHKDWLTVPEMYYTETAPKTYKVKCESKLGEYPGFRRIQFSYSDDNFLTKKYFPEIYPDATLYGPFVFESLMLDGINIKIDGNYTDFEVNEYVTIQIDKSEVQTRWNGFWMRKDPPKINNKLFYSKYESNDPRTDIIAADSFSKELGINYGVQSYKVISTGAPYNWRIYSLCIELDGSQAIFVKNLLTTIHNEPGTGVFHGSLTIDLYFEYWFDRSITAHLLFLGLDDNLYGNLNTKRILNTGKLLVNTKIEGYFMASDMGVTIDTNTNKLKVNLITSQGGPGSGENDLYPEDHATGETLEGYLNNKYYSDVDVRAKSAAAVGEDIIGVNLKYDKIDVTKDAPESMKNPRTMMCLSQFQREAVHTNSLMCVERIKQLSKGGKILKIVGTIGSQFLIFTRDECRWAEVLNSKTFLIQTHGIFDDKGAVNADCVVKAVNALQTQTGPTNAPVTSEFEGVFYFSKDTCRGFYNNQPVDLFEVKDGGKLLFTTWKNEYQALSDEVKDNIKGGYYYNKKEAWWQIGDEIRIWCIPYKHWKIYSFPDEVTQFLQEEDGELYFSTARQIYKTEREGTAKWKDKQSTVSPEYIPFHYEQVFTHGNIAEKKVLHGFELNYEVEGILTGRDNPQILIQAGREDVNNDLHNEKATVLTQNSNRRYIKRIFDKRTRGGWWRLRIGSDTASLSILKQWTTLQTKVKAFFTKGTITTQ